MPDDSPVQDRAEVTEAGEPARLRGRRCGGCAVTAYPADGACPRCGRATSAVTLSAEGRLWTWTVQRFAPKAPPYAPPAEGFRPFAVGYVELPEGVRVAAVLDTDDFDSIRIGMPVRIGPTGGVPRAVPVEETP
ncbi:Zn-ribbon domain-containing OB-fold protein [Nonomuraea basaltis]|uniref:Zn-ribbon domain-containing OB-fold protein n=1 Tax=Nonomuraea basaltis TaxID=2495887 RepID=UPI00110C5249|nr:OB-fold domain-containing protein [Nonomuraea basaltis]TMR94059.1 DNA-binding protein [Nonomuraea basaltis]